MFVVVGVLFGMGLVWLVVAGLVIGLAGGVRVVAWVVSAFAGPPALASGLGWWWAVDRRGLDSPRTPVLLAGVLWLLVFVCVGGVSQSPLSAP